MIARKGAFVLVADGGGATLYRIANRVSGVKLDDVEAIENEVPAHTAEIGRDKPPRANASTGHTSALEQKDLHDAAEELFAGAVARRLDRLARDAHKGVILFASPRFLGVLRPLLSDAGRACLKAEISKDMRNLRLADLEHAVDALDAKAEP